MSRDALTLEAYRRLGVDASAVARAPQITPQLHAIQATVRRAGQPRITTNVRELNDGATMTEQIHHAAPYGPGADILTSWPQYLHASDSADSGLVLNAYYTLPKTLSRLLPVEAFCVAANVSPLRLLEIITATIVRQGAQASAIIASVNHPRVVEKTVEMALTDGGESDRRALDRATGFLPTAKGPSVVVNASASANASAQAASVTAPPPEQTIRRLSDRLNAARGLPTSDQQVPALPASSAIDIPSSSSAASAREPMTINLPLDDEEEEGDMD